MQKTVTFIGHNITREFSSDHLKAQFKFSVINSALIGTPKERRSIHSVDVTITDYLMDYWRLAGAIDATIVTEDMVKVAFQTAEDYITEQLKKGPLPEGKLPPVFLSTENSSKSCPYNLSNISYPNRTTFTVEIDERLSQPLEKCLNDFSIYVQSEVRMTFWQNDKAKKKYKWVSHPEQHAKNLLRTFLNGRFGNDLYTFEEIRAGAGVIDVFIVSPNGQNAVIELKMCGHSYSQAWAQAGLQQVTHYMKNRGTETGYLIIFDSRIRDFSQGFQPIETINGMSVTVVVADLRPYVKRERISDHI